MIPQRVWLGLLLGLLPGLLLMTSVAAAPLPPASLRPFTSGSLANILAARVGQPFILTFWSIDCTHCPKELKTLGELKQQYPQLDIVLVSTDVGAHTAALAAFAARQQLAGAEQWIFAEAQADRLRYEIDRHWWGELPRTYFFDARHQRTALSGLVPRERLERWAKEGRD
jgi:thiol-disulfide isomerase/thioredoxin